MSACKLTVPEKLAMLQESMKTRELAAYIVVTDDFHGSEYVGEYFKTRSFLSGFTGSAGTLVVTPDWSGLWTDGRYFLQAASQLQDSTVELMKMGEPGVPTLPEKLEKLLPDGARVGFDGRTVSNGFVESLQKKLRDKHVEYVCGEDLADAIWTDRPPLSAEPVWELDTRYTGLSREEKLSKVREAMAKEKADFLVLAALDEIAWLLNLRGNDVACSPVFLAFMLVDGEGASLCVQGSALSDTIREKLSAAGVTVRDYGDIYGLLEALPAGKTLWLDGSSANYRIRRSVPEGVRTVDKQSPVIPMKAVKTPEEIEHIRTAHVKDGVAVTRFIRWLKGAVGQERVTELSASEKLLTFRAQMEGFLEPSFESIIAYGPHGAIVHYSPSEETDAVMEPRSFCLCDTGGHYLEGSTDITRTVALGTPTEEEKRAFTLVLMGHLRLGAARFLHGCCGANLDILARQPLWENGLDFNHGTGHGVGYLLNVHEGPQRIHWRIPTAKSHAVLEDGMVVSNEPGLYLTDKFGIRHENLVLVQKGERTDYGQFMLLENLTMVPFDRDAIDTALMTERDLALLNEYHRTVYSRLSPYFEGEELQWLQNATAPMEKASA